MVKNRERLASCGHLFIVLCFVAIFVPNRRQRLHKLSDRASSSLFQKITIIFNLLIR